MTRFTNSTRQKKARPDCVRFHVHDKSRFFKDASTLFHNEAYFSQNNQHQSVDHRKPTIPTLKLGGKVFCVASNKIIVCLQSSSMRPSAADTASDYLLVQ